jgi:hypothetical protein
MATGIFTIKEFEKYLSGLPSKLRKEAGGTMVKEMAEDMARRLRFNAPGNFTSSLKKDIKATQRGKVWAIMGPKHWQVVDRGIKPNSLVIPVELAEEHMMSPGSTVGKKKGGSFDTKGYILNPGPKRAYRFVDKSIKSFDNNLPNIVNRGIERAFSK